MSHKRKADARRVAELKSSSAPARFADAILPAVSFTKKHGTDTSADRRVQLGGKAIDPPGEARPDREVIADIATRTGYPRKYRSPAHVFHEMTVAVPPRDGP